MSQNKISDTTMTQTRPARPRIATSTKPPGPPPHLLLMELKHRILAALSKLADRDTQQLAVEDLEKIVETLPPDCVSVCLSCLYDADIQQKSVVKKECIRLFGSLASLHGDLLAPHLPKIIASIMRRLRDPDTSVRDACVDAMGVLSARFLSSSATGTANGRENGAQAASASALTAFVKPLFDALSEQNKGVQTGAAMCLARVIETARSPSPSGMQRLCLRISKFLSNPNFLAKAALLPIFGSLSQVGGVSQQHLAMLMPCMHEAVESSDWATRKAAAETLGRLGLNLGPALAIFKASTLLILESCRFDKVKPVRDSIQDAIQLWKNLPGAEMDGSGAGTKLETASIEDRDLSSTMRNLNLRTPSPTLSETTSVTEVPKASEPTADDNSNQPPRSTADKSVPPKKKIPTLTDRKPNPDFFQKLETRSSDDWQIEVAVPRTCRPSLSASHVEQHECVDDRDLQELLIWNTRKGGKRVNSLVQSCLANNDVTYSQHDQISERQSGEFDDNSETSDLLINNTALDGNAAASSLVNKKLKARQSEASPWLDTNLRQRDVENLSWEGQHASGRANWFLVQRQLSQLEHQQSNLMGMLQEFMSSSQETMFALETRVRGLERIVEDLAQDLAPPSGRRTTGYEGGGVKFSNNYHLGPDYINHKFGKGMDTRASPAERLVASDAAIPGARGVRDSTWRSSSDFDTENWDAHGYNYSKAGPLGSLIDGQVGSRRSNTGALIDWTRAGRDDLRGEQMVNRRGWDRVSGPTRLGEGPSARSVWQASKDEATLAAIRVVGEDTGALEGEAPSSEVSGLITPNSGSESVSYKTEGQGKGRLWSLWSCAMEYVRAGDIDSAYVEVLCSGDELMLVRLMSKTGPVLEQLSAGTATEMLHTVGRLLQQQSFFDFVISWVQQVADMVVDTGAECLGISLDAKKELLLSLQEATTMDLPEGWVGNTVDELLEQLSNAWCIDLLHNDHER